LHNSISLNTVVSGVGDVLMKLMGLVFGNSLGAVGKSYLTFFFYKVILLKKRKGEQPIYTGSIKKERLRGREMKKKVRKTEH
jgi:hypothetical protein